MHEQGGQCERGARQIGPVGAPSARGGQGRLGPWGRPMYISMKSLQGMNVCYEYDTGWYETEGRV